MDKVIIIYALIILMFLLIIVKDIKEKIIPNNYSILLIILGIILGIVENNINERILGSAVYTFPFIIIYAYGSDFLKKDAIGVGDIKLMMALGMILKFKNYYQLFLFLNICFILPLIYIILKYCFLRKLEKEIAFGPFLIITFFILKILEFHYE